MAASKPCRMVAHNAAPPITNIGMVWALLFALMARSRDTGRLINARPKAWSITVAAMSGRAHTQSLLHGEMIPGSIVSCYPTANSCNRRATRMPRALSEGRAVEDDKLAPRAVGVGHVVDWPVGIGRHVSDTPPVVRSIDFNFRRHMSRGHGFFQ